ncbi:MAG TPA: NrfD/PsrC family molybdoenzyme membrane anchor subunit [Rhodocyclaceae bacterium]|nr:NrfD/PsrC family molybdoenzyme membrane anchor subunit [Rhodocyclaceae bacterium]
MNLVPYSRTEEKFFYALAALGGLVVAIGLAAALYMEHSGHVVTGMNNQVVWGIPHVFAIFLIVAASGVLNVASIGSVFGKKVYKKRAPLSGLLTLAMLSGGLFVLMLDLGRADRVMVAATQYNFTSVFAWNVFLYSGMFGIVAVYLWTLMERRMNPWSHAVGLSAFIWRLILTTGTGSIFGFLVARQAYQSAVLAPMFIIMSFAWGLAVFIIVQAMMFRWNSMALHPSVLKRMKNLLGLFVAAALYFVAVYHLTNLYFAKQMAFEKFLLVDSAFAPLFWIGQVFLGSIVPLALLYHPTLGMRCGAVLSAAILIVIGAFITLYVFIIGGQAFPLEIFPGMTVTSSYFDGQVGTYAPSLPEVLLGIGGIAVAFVITVIGIRALNFLPEDDLAQLDEAAAHQGD